MTKIYQFKITIAGSTPPIWRRVLVPQHFTLEELHEVIQTCFDWEGYHLYCFEYLGERYDDEKPELLSKTLKTLNLSEKNQLNYIYDFGDNWEHILLLEKIIAQDKEKTYSCCIAGELTAPPEDVGGVWGYEDTLAILSDKSHPKHVDITEWMGENFDPDAFDINAINERLKHLALANVS